MQERHLIELRTPYDTAIYDHSYKPNYKSTIVQLACILPNKCQRTYGVYMSLQEL